jgi:hypothetical protein
MASHANISVAIVLVFVPPYFTLSFTILLIGSTFYITNVLLALPKIDVDLQKRDCIRFGIVNRRTFGVRGNTGLGFTRDDLPYMPSRTFGWLRCHSRTMTD